MFHIVEFDKAGALPAIEIVPKEWFDAEQEKCWWPPSSFQRHRVSKMIIDS